jgi:hypothetical protein
MLNPSRMQAPFSTFFEKMGPLNHIPSATSLEPTGTCTPRSLTDLCFSLSVAPELAGATEIGGRGWPSLATAHTPWAAQ